MKTSRLRSDSPIPRSESRPRTLRHPRNRRDDSELNLKVNATPDRAREKTRDVDLSSNQTKKSHVHEEKTSSKTPSKLKEKSPRSSSGDGRSTPKPSTSRAATRQESPAATKQDTPKRKESLNPGPSSPNKEKTDAKPTASYRVPKIAKGQKTKYTLGDLLLRGYDLNDYEEREGLYTKKDPKCSRSPSVMIFPSGTSPGSSEEEVQVLKEVKLRTSTPKENTKKVRSLEDQTLKLTKEEEKCLLQAAKQIKRRKLVERNKALAETLANL